MTFPKRALFAAALVITGISLGAITNCATVSPTEQTKSRFLLRYGPSAVVSSFEKPNGMSTWATDGAGSVLPWARRDVVHNVDFLWNIRPSQVVTDALFKETKQALSASGAEIVSAQMANRGFAIAYRTGPITGSIVADWRESSRDAGRDEGLHLSGKERRRI